MRNAGAQFLDDNTSFRTSRTHEPTAKPSLLAQMVQHVGFQWFSTTIIVTSTIFEGYLADSGMRQTLVSPEQGDPEWTMTFAASLAILFGIEVICRLYAYRKLYFTGPDRLWNVYSLCWLLAAGRLH